MISIKKTVTIQDGFRDVIKRQNYEELILKLVNKSRYILPDLNLKSVTSQSNGECDFTDKNGRKYDAKLLIDTKQGALIGDRKNEINKWLEEMLDEVAEFSSCIFDREHFTDRLLQTKLYRIMKDRITSLTDDEIGLLFIPYPIVDDFANNIFGQFASDYIQAVYGQLVEEGVVGDRDIYFIYPGATYNEYVLRDSSHHREFIEMPEIDELINYHTYV